MTMPSMPSASMPSAASSAHLLTGVFAISEYGGTSGLIEGNSQQVVNQAIGVGNRLRL